MALINRVGDVRRLSGLPFMHMDLVKNSGRSGKDRSEPNGQIVVGEAAVVEMKSANHFMVQQPGHYLLNILSLIVMTGVDQNQRLWSGILRQQESHAPVGNIRVIKGGLKACIRSAGRSLGAKMRMNFFRSDSSDHAIEDFRMF